MEKFIKDTAKKLQNEYHREWSNRNREHLRAYHREWRKNNPDKVKAINERYWERKAIEFLGLEEDCDECFSN